MGTKQIFSLCILGAVTFVLFGGTFLFWSQKFQQTYYAALHVPEKPDESITLLFVGDIMLDRGVEWAVHKYGSGDWRWPLLPIADTIQQADLLFGNLESQISDKGTNVGSIYSFRAEPESIETLLYGGFDVLSVTNNHSFDYTREALDDSTARLRTAGIQVAPATLKVQDVTIAFLAYQQWRMPQDYEMQIKAAQADLIVVSLHAGEEYAQYPSDFQKSFAKSAIDSGADLVVGHHPHVLQPLEQYKDGWIIYSLGNFLFDQTFSEETMRAAILKVVVENKKIKEVSLLPTKITPSFQVHLIEQ
jgi:gamma-polyglutamate biosynthesis protein CapA